jgi:hypothetical protein
MRFVILTPFFSSPSSNLLGHFSMPAKRTPSMEAKWTEMADHLEAQDEIAFDWVIGADEEIIPKNLKARKRRWRKMGRRIFEGSTPADMLTQLRLIQENFSNQAVYALVVTPQHSLAQTQSLHKLASFLQRSRCDVATASRFLGTNSSLNLTKKSRPFFENLKEDWVSMSALELQEWAFIFNARLLNKIDFSSPLSFHNFLDEVFSSATTRRTIPFPILHFSGARKAKKLKRIFTSLNQKTQKISQTLPMILNTDNLNSQKEEFARLIAFLHSPDQDPQIA